MIPCLLTSHINTPTTLTTVRLLREELYHLQEPGSYVGEVIKAMGKTKVRREGRMHYHHHHHLTGK